MTTNLTGFDVTTPPFVTSLAGILLVFGVYKISTFIYDEVTSPVREVPGPPSPSFLYGNLKELPESEGWVNQYGPTIKFSGVLGTSRLLTTDLKAVNYILFNSYDYVKTREVSYFIRQLVGGGLVGVEGDVHKHQRKILNPAFGPQQLRELTEIFVEKALELRDIWSTEIMKHGGVGSIECLTWMSRTTLDIIGLAGFDYKFDSLTCDPEKNELMESFATVVRAGTNPPIILILRALYPPLRFLPTLSDIARRKSSTALIRISSNLLKQTKAAYEDDKQNKSSGRKDILTLLVQANTMEDLPAEQRMTDEDIMAQIPTFLLAGYETTSIAMVWALYALTQNKHAQTKLRLEISDVPTDNPTMDDVNGLPYLDAVVREILRLHPPVPISGRAAEKDDYIPLSKPFTDRKGIVRNEIRIRKGQVIDIPIFLINRDKSIWGEDSTEFKPERWDDIPDAAQSIPGAWANIMTFLGGPRACIGFRFSLLEIKVLLFTLIRAFEFDLAVSPKDIGISLMGIQRPVLLTDPNNPNHLPLLVRPISKF